MQRMRWTTGIIVALFMSGLVQIPLSSMNPAYATEGAGGDADDGGGNNGHINVVMTPSKPQVTSGTGLHDSRTAPIHPAPSDQWAVRKTRIPHDRDQPKRHRDHGTEHNAGEL